MNPQGLFVSPFILSCSEFPNNISKYYKQMFLLMYLHDSIIKLACTQLIHITCTPLYQLGADWVLTGCQLSSILVPTWCLHEHYHKQFMNAKLVNNGTMCILYGNFEMTQSVHLTYYITGKNT